MPKLTIQIVLCIFNSWVISGYQQLTASHIDIALDYCKWNNMVEVNDSTHISFDLTLTWLSYDWFRHILDIYDNGLIFDLRFAPKTTSAAPYIEMNTFSCRTPSGHLPFRYYQSDLNVLKHWDIWFNQTNIAVWIDREPVVDTKASDCATPHTTHTSATLCFSKGRWETSRYSFIETFIYETSDFITKPYTPTFSPTLAPSRVPSMPTTNYPSRAPSTTPTQRSTAPSHAPTETKTSCGTRTWCYYSDLFPTPGIVTSQTINIQNPDDAQATNFNIYITIQGSHCIEPTITFTFEEIDFSSSNEYLDVFDNDGSKVDRCSGTLDSNCGNWMTCFTDRNLKASQISRGDTYMIRVYEPSSIDDLCSHDLSINANLTFTCSGNTASPTSLTSAPTERPSTTPTQRSTAPSHAPTETKTSCGTRTWCYYSDLFPIPGIVTAQTINIQNPDDEQATNFKIYITIQGSDCIEPTITFTFEEIDFQMSTEYLDVFDNDGSKVDRCSGTRDSNCGNWMTCFADRNLKASQISRGDTYMIRVYESIAIDSLCSHDLSINANLTFTCSDKTASTSAPTESPTSPTYHPTKDPTGDPTIDPTSGPTTVPTFAPTSGPSRFPSNAPSAAPSINPTNYPSNAPSMVPSTAPTTNPTLHPTIAPSSAPSIAPSLSPIYPPSNAPTNAPSIPPSQSPSIAPSASPSLAPSIAPSIVPSRSPSSSPSVAPTASPTNIPSSVPSINPTLTPSSAPTAAPSLTPSETPTIAPTNAPSINPTLAPSSAPTAPSLTPSKTQTIAPSTAPSLNPTNYPSSAPSIVPSTAPTQPPTTNPTLHPTIAPSSAPSIAPSKSPSSSPSVAPTTTPTGVPSSAPSINPTLAPSPAPTTAPSLTPSNTPTIAPTTAPSLNPTNHPSNAPSMVPSTAPTQPPTTNPTLHPTIAPSSAPSIAPSKSPSSSPSVAPTITPTGVPSSSPSINPTVAPSLAPTTAPSLTPSETPTIAPTTAPSSIPTKNPSVNPSLTPTRNPTNNPSLSPTATPSLTPTLLPSTAPSLNPTNDPTITPTIAPSLNPTETPSVNPSLVPTRNPTNHPSLSPTATPSLAPTLNPTLLPSTAPSLNPTNNPTFSPSQYPTKDPTQYPTYNPSMSPTLYPTSIPTNAPSASPSIVPSISPTLAPSSNPSIAPSIAPSDTPSVSPTNGPSFSPSMTPTANPVYNKDYEYLTCLNLDQSMQLLYDVTQYECIIYCLYESPGCRMINHYSYFRMQSDSRCYLYDKPCAISSDISSTNRQSSTVWISETLDSDGDCINFPPKWKDKVGDTCDMYEQFGLCANNTLIPSDMTYTNTNATEACCQCSEHAGLHSADNVNYLYQHKWPMVIDDAQSECMLEHNTNPNDIQYDNYDNLVLMEWCNKLQSKFDIKIPCHVLIDHSLTAHTIDLYLCDYLDFMFLYAMNTIFINMQWFELYTDLLPSSVRVQTMSFGSCIETINDLEELHQIYGIYPCSLVNDSILQMPSPTLAIATVMSTTDVIESEESSFVSPLIMLYIIIGALGFCVLMLLFLFCILFAKRKRHQHDKGTAPHIYADIPQDAPHNDNKDEHQGEEGMELMQERDDIDNKAVQIETDYNKALEMCDVFETLGSRHAFGEESRELEIGDDINIDTQFDALDDPFESAHCMVRNINELELDGFGETEDTQEIHDINDNVKAEHKSLSVGPGFVIDSDLIKLGNADDSAFVNSFEMGYDPECSVLSVLDNLENNDDSLQPNTHESASDRLAETEDIDRIVYDRILAHAKHLQLNSMINIAMHEDLSQLTHNPDPLDPSSNSEQHSNTTEIDKTLIKQVHIELELAANEKDEKYNDEINHNKQRNDDEEDMQHKSLKKQENVNASECDNAFAIEMQADSIVKNIHVMAEDEEQNQQTPPPFEVCPVWDAYIKQYGFPPQSVSHLLSFSKYSPDMTMLTYVNAREIFNRRKNNGIDKIYKD